MIKKHIFVYNCHHKYFDLVHFKSQKWRHFDVYNTKTIPPSKKTNQNQTKLFMASLYGLNNTNF